MLLCGACGAIASQLLFGFSQNFAWAVGARIMWGLLDGNMAVGKTYLSEVRNSRFTAYMLLISMSTHLSQLTK